MPRLLFSSLICLIATSFSQAAFTITFDFNGAPGNQASSSGTVSPTGILTLTALSRGTGLTPSAAGTSISSSGWSTSSLDFNDYYTFQITPINGFALNLNTLAYNDQRSGTGPQNFAIRTSLDNFTADLSTYSSTLANTSATPRSINVSTLQSITAPLEFRIYGWNATSTAGTYRIGTSGNSALTLTGTEVVPAPAPPSFVLLLMGLPAFSVMRRYRGSREL